MKCTYLDDVIKKRCILKKHIATGITTNIKSGLMILLTNTAVSNAKVASNVANTLFINN